MMKTSVLPSDWHRNPGMALRTARFACFEHESLLAMIDVCPPSNTEGLFEVDSDAWAVAKLYTSHDELEGVQFRTQMEIADINDMAIVVRELADKFYDDYTDDEPRRSTPPAETPWDRGSESRPHCDENHSLTDFE